MENFTNKNVILYLETMFNKKINDISQEDLKLIKTLPIDALNNRGEEEFFDYSLLKCFPNLVEISIYNSIIDNRIVSSIRENVNIMKINFNKCAFVNVNDLNELDNKRALSFINCFIENYSFLNYLRSLEELCIKNPYLDIDIDLSCISQSSKLNKVVLEGCTLLNINCLSFLKECNYLSLLWSDLKEDDISFLIAMPSLKEVIIDSKYKENEVLEKLNDDVDISYDLIKYGFSK